MLDMLKNRDSLISGVNCNFLEGAEVQRIQSYLLTLLLTPLVSFAVSDICLNLSQFEVLGLAAILL